MWTRRKNANQIRTDKPAGALSDSDLFFVAQGGSIDVAAGLLSALFTWVRGKLGTLAIQNANAVNFTGGTMTGVAIHGLSAPALGGDAANKTYVDGIVAAQDAMVFKGVIDASANPNYPAADRGWTYRISVAGKIGGGSGVNVEIGDTITCLTDGTVAGTQAAVGASWSIIQTNIDGAVIGPASVTDDLPAVFDGTTGKLLKSKTYAALRDSIAVGAIRVKVTGVNLNSAGTDTAITVPLPAGASNYVIQSFRAHNPSAVASTATFGLFSATGGGGTTVIAATAVAFSSTAANTAGNMQQVGPASPSTTSYNFTTLYLRNVVAQGSALTADFTLTIFPL